MSDSKIMVGFEVNTDIPETRTEIRAGLGDTSVAAVLPWLLQPWASHGEGRGSPSGSWHQFHTQDLERKRTRKEQQSQPMTGKMQGDIF